MQIKQIKIRNSTGFTLLELLITLTIMLILALGSFSFVAFFTRSMQQSDTTRLFHTLQFARSEAIKRNEKILVCPSHNFQDCTTNWTDGYMVFRFLPHQIDDKEILRVEKRNSLAIISSNLDKIQYGNDGRCFTRGTINIQVNDSHIQRIVLYDSGRARLE